MGRNDYVRKDYPIEVVAYMAGIVDGEGSLYIGNFSSNPNTGEAYYQTALQVCNTEETLIDWIMTKFGGLKTKRTLKQHALNSRRQAWMWTATGERLTHICELILPLSTCKVRQIEIILEMRATYNLKHSKADRPGHSQLPHHIRDKRAVLMSEMKALHCRSYSDKLHKDTIASGDHEQP